MVSRIEVAPWMGETAVKGSPILTPLINMSQSGEVEGGQAITIIVNDEEDENYEHFHDLVVSLRQRISKRAVACNLPSNK